MGCDIQGFVEVEKYNWFPAGRVGHLTRRDYNAFGMLFGVRGREFFEEAFFRGRGIPEELSEPARREVEEYRDKGFVGAVDFHSPSYFYYEELEDIDWERSVTIGDRTAMEVTRGGQPLGAVAIPEDFTEEQMEKLRDGEVVEYESHTVGVTRLEQRDLTMAGMVSDEWQWFLFDFLPTLNDRFPDERIRVFVWFDN